MIDIVCFAVIIQPPLFMKSPKHEAKSCTLTTMKLSDYDLLQLTEEELLELPDEILRRLSVKLLIDLKEARERLRQTISK